MPNLLEFRIKNFRGARSVKIDLGKRHNSPVITLVGLNESGKTTILESISHFSGYDEALDLVLGYTESRKALHSFIPIEDESAFTGDVQIEAEIGLTEQDKFKLVSKFAEAGHSLIFNSIRDTVSVSVKYEFIDSRFVESKFSSYWSGVDYDYVPAGKRKTVSLNTSTPSEKLIWKLAVDNIKDALPQIVYFPTFLVDMPKRIYLKKIGTEEDMKNDYYFRILQNIARLSDKKVDLNKHVVDRLDSFKVEDGTTQWVQNYLGSVSRRPINAVFGQMSSVVSNRIIASWRDVIGKAINIDRVSFNLNFDPSYDNTPYITISIHDRDSEYDLNQRSLGFRWFFSFLLFTTFGGLPDRRKLFLFDEPAANLHVRAQTQLLKSFSFLISRGDRIIYSTHSAHMIDERWLSGAYIVENDAIDFDRDDIDDYASRPTNIRATPYRQFVGKYPDRINYFQPVLERLQYVAPALARDKPAIIVEGPSDFYALNYARQASKIGGDWDIIPSEGSGKCGPLIALYLGRGVPFLVLLDDDAAGRKEKRRYLDDWSLSAGSVMTLADVDSRLTGMAIEGLLDEDSKKKIEQKFGPAPTKKAIGMYLAEACARGEADWLSEGTLNSLGGVLNKASAALQ